MNRTKPVRDIRDQTQNTTSQSLWKYSIALIATWIPVWLWRTLIPRNSTVLMDRAVCKMPGQLLVYCCAANKRKRDKKRQARTVHMPFQHTFLSPLLLTVSERQVEPKRPVLTGQLISLHLIQIPCRQQQQYLNLNRCSIYYWIFIRFINSGTPPENNTNTYILSIKSLKLAKFVKFSVISLNKWEISKFQSFWAKLQLYCN